MIAVTATTVKELIQKIQRKTRNNRTGIDIQNYTHNLANTRRYLAFYLTDFSVLVPVICLRHGFLMVSILSLFKGTNILKVFIVGYVLRFTISLSYLA